jgi:hypothetical protein
MTVAQRTAIRSAPSDEAYATDFLAPNTRLQVWRHDPNGWLAIRPPVGSFALIEAKNCSPTNNPDVFTVSVDRTKAWVGTRVDDEHSPISQVRLKQGEPIAVISSLIIEEPSGPQTWYQIEPPSGEFRWVHVDDLRSPGPGSAGTTRRPQPSDLAGRPQRPLDGPLSGYLPRFEGTTTTDSGPAAGDWPTLDLDSAGSRPAGAPGGPETASTGSNPTAWRAAQQVTPAIPNDPAGFVASGLTPADNPLANPAFSPSWMQTASHGAQADDPSAGSNQGGFVKPIPAQPTEASPGDLWDQAVNRLRQDPVANAIASQPPLASGGESSLATGGQLTSHPWAAGDWNQQLANVQASLVRETAQPNQPWNLMPLLEQCRELWKSAPSPVQQQAAADVGRRIEALLQLPQGRPQANDLSAQAGSSGGGMDPWAGQRFASAGPILPGWGGAPAPALNGQAPPGLPPGGNPNPAMSPPGVSAPGVSAPGVSPPGLAPGLAYDAVGYLKELIMARGQKSSEYVLQDETGRSICHLAAQPGVNLNNYLDKKVGVIGITGLHAKFKLPHVNVERIYPVP